MIVAKTISNVVIVYWPDEGIYDYFYRNNVALNLALKMYMAEIGIPGNPDRNVILFQDTVYAAYFENELERGN